MGYTIGIAGIGFVGDALYTSFRRQVDVTIKPYDRFKNIGSEADLLDTDFVFLCLPTLYSEILGSYDKTAIHAVCKFLSDASYTGAVIIKSTVEPGTSDDLSHQYGLNIIHNPEFLTARTAREDFHNQRHVVLGLTSAIKRQTAKWERIIEFYSTYYPEAEISLCDSWESEAMKSFVNTYYAVKIQMFNEFYLLCEKEKRDFETIRKLMLRNGWIHPMHTMVPGPDGQLSYGGACFPKDTQALLQHMKRQNTPHAVLESCIQERNSLRMD